MNIITDVEFLSRKCIDVNTENINLIKDIVLDLTNVAQENIDNCAGLAANQIGYQSRIFLMKRDNYFLAFINPKMLCGTDGFKNDFESCLSRPNQKPIKIRRYKTVVLEYYTLKDGKIEKIKQKFKGFEARVVQHELDHFEGKLI